MMNRTLNRTLRGRATCALLAAVAAGTLGLAVATAGPASAATFPGPPAMPGGTVLPAPGHLGNPANIYAGSTSSGQVIEDAFDSSAWAARPARSAPTAATLSGSISRSAWKLTDAPSS
jgi:hypothetical protein